MFSEGISKSRSLSDFPDLRILRDAQYQNTFRPQPQAPGHTTLIFIHLIRTTIYPQENESPLDHPSLGELTYLNGLLFPGIATLLR